MADLFTCKGKGGTYEDVGTAVGAGTSRGEIVRVYRDTVTGNLYYRAPTDFAERMESICPDGCANPDQGGAGCMAVSGECAMAPVVLPYETSMQRMGDCLRACGAVEEGNRWVMPPGVLRGFYLYASGEKALPLKPDTTNEVSNQSAAQAVGVDGYLRVALAEVTQKLEREAAENLSLRAELRELRATTPIEGVAAPVEPSDDQVRDAALAECEAICNNVHDQYHAQRLIRELRASGKKPNAPPVAAEQPAAEQAKAAHVDWRNEKDGRPAAAGNVLTDEQIDDMARKACLDGSMIVFPRSHYWREFARAIEQLLRAAPQAAQGEGLTEALERVAAYIERRKKSRGLDIEHVHGFDLGPNEGVELLLSDIETIAAHTRASDGKDAERLDFAMRNVSGSGWACAGVFYEDGCDREAIDAAMQQAASNQQEGAK